MSSWEEDGSQGHKEIESMASLRNHDVCGSRRCVGPFQGSGWTILCRQKMDARPGRQRGRKSWQRPIPGVWVDSPLSWEGWRDSHPPPPIMLATIMISDSFTLPQLGQIPLSRLRKWVARNGREQPFWVSSICRLSQSQITSKCGSPRGVPGDPLPAATALWRHDESVGPQGSRWQQNGPRGCHCLGEWEHCAARLSFHIILAQVSPSQHTYSFRWVLPGVCLGSSCRRPSVWTGWSIQEWRRWKRQKEETESTFHQLPGMFLNISIWGAPSQLQASAKRMCECSSRWLP